MQTHKWLNFLIFFTISGDWHNFGFLHCGVYRLLLLEDPPGHARAGHPEHHGPDVFQHFSLVSLFNNNHF